MKFFFSQIQDSDALKQFLHNLNAEYSKKAHDKILKPNAGIICCAQTDTNQWQRCQILQLHTSKECTIQLLDIGLIARVKWSNLRMLDENTFQTKPFAVRCSLLDHFNKRIEHITFIQLTQFREIIEMQRKFYMFVAQVDTKSAAIYLYYKVNKTFKCLNKIFMENASTEDTTSSIVVATESKPMSDRERIILSHFESIDSIYICMVKHQNAMDHLHEMMRQMADSTDDLLSIDWKIDDHCIVEQTFDARKQWFRGRIVSLDGNDECRIFLRDVGRQIDAKLSALRPIDANCQNIQNFALKCRLSSIYMNENTSAELVKGSLLDLINAYDELAASAYGTQKEVILWGVNRFNDDPYLPTRFEYANINKTLVRLGLVTSTSSFKDISNVYAERDKQKLIEINRNRKQLEKDFDLIDEQIANGKLFVEPTIYTITTDIMDVRYWLPSEKIEKIQFIAYPMYVNEKCEIFLMDDYRKGIADRMCEILHKRFKKKALKAIEPLQLRKNAPCFAPYNGRFHRAVIRKVSSDIAVASRFDQIFSFWNLNISNFFFFLQIRFMDYGNVEKCLITDLRKADMFGDVPVLARLYHLHNIRFDWSHNVRQFIADTIIEKQCNIEVIECTKCQLIDKKNELPIEECIISIFTKDKSLGNALILREFAKPMLIPSGET